MLMVYTGNLGTYNDNTVLFSFAGYKKGGFLGELHVSKYKRLVLAFIGWF